MLKPQKGLKFVDMLDTGAGYFYVHAKIDDKWFVAEYYDRGGLVEHHFVDEKWFDDDDFMEIEMFPWEK
jgi:hypothetical protein